MTDNNETTPFDQRLFNTYKHLLTDSDRGLTFEAGKRQVDGILDTLKTCENFTSEEVGEMLSRLLLLPDVCAATSNSGKPFDEQATLNRIDMADYLSLRGFAELFVRITIDLEPYITTALFNDDAQIGFNFSVLCLSFLNFSDKCSLLGEDFSNNGGVDVLMRIAKRLDSDANDKLNKEHVKVFHSLISILHNCTRHSSVNRHVYRQANVVDFFESKTRSKHLNIRIGSVLVLSQVADEKVTERVAPNLDCVLLLVELLRRAVRPRSHTIEVLGEQDGSSRYSAQELVNALTHLAINDDNKVAIQTCGGIPILVSMLQTKFSDEESLEAFTLLWHLVFVDDIKRETVVQEIVEIFEILMNSKAYFMREIAKYVLWEIRNHEMTFPTESVVDMLMFERPPFYLSVPLADDRRSRCIVISCQGDSQTRALYIKDKLVERGYVVWINEYTLRENILEEKIIVIQQAVVILICVTERYKESPSCRSESSYAKKLGKPLIPLLMDSEYQPDGWLEKLLETNSLNHRFCTDSDMDSNLQGLVNDLGDRGKANPVRVLGTRFKSAIKKLRTTIGTNDEAGGKYQDNSFQAESIANPRYWSSRRLQAWLRVNGLETLRLPQDLWQGNQLLQMYGHYKKDAAKFSDAFKSDFNLDDNTVRNFTAAMSKLFK